MAEELKVAEEQVVAESVAVSVGLLVPLPQSEAVAVDEIEFVFVEQAVTVTVGDEDAH